MKLGKTVLAALRGDPELKPAISALLREKAERTGPLSTVVQAAGAIEPILERAVRKRPSKLGKLGLRSSRLLASLAVEDERSNRRLAHIARGKTVAIVFIDVAGFTTLTEQRGDDEAIALLNRLNTLINRTVKLGQGECVKRLGDGFLLAFPSSSQAIRAMVALRQTMERERERDRSFDLKLRTAIHAGEPLIEEDDLLGHDVNLTARLLDHCRPGEIIVSEAAKELAGKRLKSISFGKGRTRKIRGLSSKVVIYSIAAAESGMPPARPKTDVAMAEATESGKVPDPSKTAEAGVIAH